MDQGLTEWTQRSRLLVIDVMREAGRIRVRNTADVCSELSCADADIVADDATGFDAIGPGDVIRVEDEPGAGRRRVVVVRRSWEEITSPEF